MGSSTKATVVATAVVAVFLALAAAPWFLMISLGSIHGSYPSVPHPGFWTCFWVIVAVSTVSSVAGRAARGSKEA